jgi:hypothetical protein
MSVPYRFVHIGFSFTDQEPPAEELEKLFSTAVDWVRYDMHCWILYSNTELDTWRDRIRKSPSIKDTDAFFLCEFDKDGYSGFQYKMVWDFLSKVR